MAKATVEMLQDTQNLLQILVNIQKTFGPDMKPETLARAERLQADICGLIWQKAYKGDEKAIRFLTALSK
jgi:hypothetical protein